jgi:phage/plasmid-like protein (TIGR03299 family)
VSAEFENGVFGANKPAWHGLGTVVEEDVLTAAQVIEYVPELGYEVELVPLVVPWNGQTLSTDRFATVRADGNVLGVGLSDQYTVIPNADAFAWIDGLVDTGDAKYHTAMTLREGSQAVLLAKIAREMIVGGLDSEQVDTYLVCANSFDGSMSLTTKVTPIRVVCANTLQMALDGGGREFKIRHVTTVEGRMEEARRALGLTFEYLDVFEETANELVVERFSNLQMEKLLERLIPLPVNADPQTDRSAKNKAEERAAVMAIFAQADNLANVRNTKWAALNAVAEYHDHHGKFRARGADEADAEDVRMENRLLRVANDYRMKDKALALLTA